MYVGHPPSTTSRIDLRHCKSLALVVALVLSLGAFVFETKEAQAEQQQQPAVVQQFKLTASGEDSATMDTGAAKPVAQAPSVVSPAAENPLTTTSPIDSTPEPVPKPTPNQTAKPTLTLTSQEDPAPATEKVRATLLKEPARQSVEWLPDRVSSGPAQPASVPALASASEPSPEPVPEPVISVESEPFSTFAQEKPAVVALQDLGSAPLPENVVVNFSSAVPIAAPSQNADHKSAASGPSYPVSLAGPLLSTTSFGMGTIAASRASSALETTVRNTTVVAAESLGALEEGSAEPSSNYTQVPSEGTPQQPAPPPVSPVEGSSFSLPGGGQGGFGGGLTLVLGCILLSGLVVLRPHAKLSLISWVVPKLSSALLQPLERPG